MRIGAKSLHPTYEDISLLDESPIITMKNTTAENGAGGCETILRGQDHEGNVLGQLEFSHSGASDDYKGQLKLSTNTGSALTTALTISDAQLATFAGNILIPDAGTIGSATATTAISIASTGIVSISGLVSEASAFPGTRATRSTVVTDAYYTGFAVQHKTSGDMVDGFGSLVTFEIRDAVGAADNTIGHIGALRAGADNTGDIVIVPVQTGVNQEAVKINNDSNVGIGEGVTFGTNMSKGLAMLTGGNPTSSPVDEFQLYSADIAAGHAALHVRNENGTIVKIYQQAHVADVATQDIAGGDTVDETKLESDLADIVAKINAILVVLENNGLLAAS